MKRVVINGATGTIGIALINKLISENVEVLVLCHRNSSRIANIPRSELVTVLECDLCELKDLNLKENYDTFFSFAWENGSLRNDVGAQIENIKYEIDAVEFAKRIGCKRFIGSGSQAEYGIKNELLSENTIPTPVTAFGMTKMYVGMISRLRAQQLGLEFIWTRILSVYGPNDGEKTMISSLITNLLNNEPVKLTECRQLWDFIYCDDAAEAMYLIAEKGINNNIYNIGSGVVRPLKEYVEIVRECINSNINIEYGAVPYSENQIMMLGTDTEALFRDTGFVAKKDFREGIIETIEWIKNKKTCDR